MSVYYRQIYFIYTKKTNFKGYEYFMGEWFKIPAFKENLLFYHGEKDINKINEFIDYLKYENSIRGIDLKPKKSLSKKAILKKLLEVYLKLHFR